MNRKRNVWLLSPVLIRQWGQGLSPRGKNSFLSDIKKESRRWRVLLLLGDVHKQSKRQEKSVWIEGFPPQTIPSEPGSQVYCPRCRFNYWINIADFNWQMELVCPFPFLCVFHSSAPVWKREKVINKTFCRSLHFSIVQNEWVEALGLFDWLSLSWVRLLSFCLHYPFCLRRLQMQRRNYGRETIEMIMEEEFCCVILHIAQNYSLYLLSTESIKIYV